MSPASTAHPRRPRICFVTTVPFAINVFLKVNIEVLRSDYDIVLIANGSAQELAGLVGGSVSFLPLPIERKISLRKDLWALILLWRVFRRERFDCVHAIMPKAGLLAMMAARLAGVPLRINTFTGQVWSPLKGFHRILLKTLDKVLVRNATRVLADSHSQRRFLIEHGVVKARDIEVIERGSVVGVNPQRFRPMPETRQRLRTEYGIPAAAVVFIYVGRLTRGKGLVDLADAFAAAALAVPAIHLMVVGRDEENLEGRYAELAGKFPGRVHRHGFTERPEDFLSAADVFCLPSYREGFGMILIEAAAAGVPAIASRIYGITDAVEDGVTGILHRPGATRELEEAMLKLAADRDLRLRMGAMARQRVMENFTEERVTRAFANFYHQMLPPGGKSRL